MSVVPVITIDGPTASGKGTITSQVAQALGWHVLDSGALYRLTALSALQKNLSLDNEAAIAHAAENLDVSFGAEGAMLEGQFAGDAIRAEEVGNTASKIAAYPQVREALLQRQRNFRTLPGLVADGRDMGTVVFTDAPLKIFLVADVRIRAERRYKQLKEKGISASLTSLLEDLQARDLRDTTRASAPLVAAADAVTIDSTYLSIEETVAKVLSLWQRS
ncbi:MAG: (d)CMP kinase [Paenalcaligenes sp.]